jgi:hypothetical protein
VRRIQKELDPDAIVAKMAEFRQDELAFYAKYGGGPSVGYDLIDEQGRRYPPAAIVQAALGWDDVKGGIKARDSAGRALAFHGFRVVEKGKRLPTKPANFDTQAERLRLIEETEFKGQSKNRIGAQALRAFALSHRICCEVTGIDDPELLRVSHIVPWSEDKAHRLNPENVILLSSLWDTAFDRGLVSFDDEGIAIFSKSLSKHSRDVLKNSEVRSLALTDDRRGFLKVHRSKHGLR